MNRFFILIGVALCSCSPAKVNKSQYVIPDGLVEGGAFIDRFMPVPTVGKLRNDVWGGDHVRPRDVDNGIEDEAWSYWGGNIVKGDDGKYHMFVCRWPENNVKGGGKKSGHHTWWSSVIVHAVSPQPLGPYHVVEEIGEGHNPEIYRRKDGSYIIGCVWKQAYKAPTLDGPWEKIPFSFQWLEKEGNETNRTYVPREDGSVLMINKQGFVFVSDQGDEQFRQVTAESFYPHIPGAHLEDPVVWKDEVQYHLVVNDCYGRVAFYFRSPDGVNWKWAPGHAYDNHVVVHEDGTREAWYKLERPKVLQDEFGRAAYMNFAAIDSKKDDDVANDNHSSKNVVVPLRVPRRLEILNREPITAETEKIRLLIKSEPGFRPLEDVDFESLRFGAPEAVNFGRGCNGIKSSAAGDGLIVTFEGRGHEITADNFTAKLIGRDTHGELLFGYARLP
ncbi:glycoside hydrolase family protein [Pontiella agarivorans]|uniref:Glycoside hydrolase family protein n=1 Tax=Pontiella agarivorans TaxID=3038953 RepID=A0ABU5MTT3_9BACT|nr:glycoside hydrolase family protein [Pontiella agarivorans]MDZ8117620.1 glycoside hydrolase family protein [Pontiella agarivorans]